MARVDAFASRPHYLEHLAPVWRALHPDERGRLFVTYRLGNLAAELDLEADVVCVGRGEVERPPRGPELTLVAGIQDAQAVAGTGRAVVLLEHGAGQSYAGSSSPAYVGGGRRDFLEAALVPSERAARDHRASSTSPAYVVGCPKLDELPARAARGPRPRVAVSFHWDCTAKPETRWAFPHYSRALRRLARSDEVELLGHGHPRAWPTLERFYTRNGIRPLERFVDVLALADVYVVDNSSTLFEAAAAGIPVVVLNAPGYRRDVEHGLRFWEAADIGPQVDHAADLEAAIELALSDPPDIAARRRAIVEDVYAHRGEASLAAAAAVRSILEEFARCP